MMKDYHFSNEFSKNIDAMIYTCGYETCKSGHSYGPAARSGYMIHYILKGKGIYKTDGKIFRLREGDAFLIHPNTLIYYEADKYDPWTYTWIGFHGIKIEPYLKRTSLLTTPFFHYGHDDRVRLCHEKMFEANQLKNNRDLMMNCIMYEYLFLLASKFPNEQISSQEKQISYVEDALHYIESHYDEEICVQNIADFLNLDRSYLYRLFKATTGVSLQEYLLDFRIRRACFLLQSTNLSINAIARSVGYKDALYFSRLFKNKKQRSPSEYRKEMKPNT